MNKSEEPNLLVSSTLDIDKDVIKRDLLETSKSLRDVEDKFYKIFDLNPCPMSIADSETGILIDVNDAFVSLTGFDSKDEIIGRASTELGLNLLKKIDRDRMMEELNSDKEIKNFVVRVKNKNGVSANALFATSFIDLNNRKCFLAICQVIKKEMPFFAFFKQFTHF